MEGIEAGNLVESDELVLDDKIGSRTRFQIKADILNRKSHHGSTCEEQTSSLWWKIGQEACRSVV
ncbi:hypothetical protein N7452_011074 [Penicillium brevicompactum]|uniref:Uncharacterized protein n=1 Tax=Penicillium brevicompactum TaxID=5074 RepID=A0A9W9Q1E1_PENBR|nr:hypothetical protein N7452_011074 [Penicillium brevicompactum]